MSGQECGVEDAGDGEAYRRVGEQRTKPSSARDAGAYGRSGMASQPSSATTWKIMKRGIPRCDLSVLKLKIDASLRGGASGPVLLPRRAILMLHTASYQSGALPAYRTRASSWTSDVIIVSESSAAMTLRVRTERCALVRGRSSAAHNDTLRYADVWPISVHTEEISSDQRVSNPRLVTNHRDHLSVPRR
jgi:hypothetical protein